MKKVFFLILSISIIAGIITYMISNFSEKRQAALIPMYVAVIDEIYENSPELNNEIEVISLDIEMVDSLDKKLKEVLLAEIKEKHKIEVLQYTTDQLKEKGYIKKGIFEKGILITITEKSAKEKKIVFDISKFKSGTAAILWNNCSAAYNGDGWNYIKGKSIQA